MFGFMFYLYDIQDKIISVFDRDYLLFLCLSAKLPLRKKEIATQNFIFLNIKLYPNLNNYKTNLKDL